jgi:glycosyltransferase involved in cell wall biosynthesis
MIAVSVVIPTRNRRWLLSEAIATVIEQTFLDWELIVVDDGSTDDTQNFLRTLHGPRIRSIRRESQGGRSMACNEGLADAVGEFIMFLDDDDLLRPHTLANLVSALRSHPDALAAVGACRLFREDGDSTKVYHPATAHARTIWREFLFGWWSNSGRNLYRTASIKEIGGFDPALPRAQDRKLWLEAAWRGRVCILPFVAMEYRQHEGQITKGPDITPVKQRIWLEFIAALPPSRQGEARAIRRAADLAQRSEHARAARRFGLALRMQLQACLIAPSLLVSPLTGRPLWWGIKKSLLRVSAP